MSDATSLLYDLEGFAVESVAEADEGPRRMVIMQIGVGARVSAVRGDRRVEAV